MKSVQFPEVRIEAAVLSGQEFQVELTHSVVIPSRKGPDRDRGDESMAVTDPLSMARPGLSWLVSVCFFWEPPSSLLIPPFSVSADNTQMLPLSTQCVAFPPCSLYFLSLDFC